MATAGRGIKGGASKTMLWHLTGRVLEHVLALPSGGGTSCPSLVRDGGRLLMSYCSEHGSK